MTQKDSQLLFKDLCTRLSYGVKISIRNDYTNTMETMTLNCFHLDTKYSIEHRCLRPFLRSMLNMEDEERKEYDYLYDLQDEYDSNIDIQFKIDLFDWLNEHHFDYRGLIEKGLALEAPEEMYKI